MSITIALISLANFLACGEKNDDTSSVEVVSDTGVVDSDDSLTDDAIDFPVGVSTIAGSGEFASYDGTGDFAAFAEPKAIRLMDDGSLIVADSGSGAIRQVQRDGTVSTLALSGSLPSFPSGIAVDGDVLYISDYEQHCIFKVEGLISTVFAGTCGSTGYQDGAGALFENPRGLIIDGQGNLLVADAGNNAIRSITPSGQVSTIAGTGEQFVASSEGPALEANVYLPFALALHPDGDLYISGFDHCIRRLHNGNLENVAGLCRNYNNTGNTDGNALDARFDTPLDIAFLPDGRLVIADSFNDRIRLLSADLQEVSTLVGSTTGYQDGGLDEALFNVPRSVTVDEQGNIYVADSINHRVRVIAW